MKNLMQEETCMKTQVYELNKIVTIAHVRKAASYTYIKYKYCEERETNKMQLI